MNDGANPENDADASPALPDLAGLANDPKRFQEAHKKYGGYLKEGGLPFELEELDDEEDSAADALAAEADADALAAEAEADALPPDADAD